jgi:hypothetical protein
MDAMKEEMAHSDNFVLREIPLSMKDESMKAVLSKSKGKHSPNYCKYSSNMLESLPILYTPNHIDNRE